MKGLPDLGKPRKKAEKAAAPPSTPEQSSGALPAGGGFVEVLSLSCMASLWLYAVDTL